MTPPHTKAAWVLFIIKIVAFLYFYWSEFATILVDNKLVKSYWAPPA
jgi:hypothetical protein